MNLKGINWIVVGGESGPKARPMKEEWALDIRDQAVSAGIPFFFKQWGGVAKWKNGRLLEGREWNELPVQAQNLRHKRNKHPQRIVPTNIIYKKTSYV
jgi:protein gp37